jgi:hypothetical protein
VANNFCSGALTFKTVAAALQLELFEQPATSAEFFSTLLGADRIAPDRRLAPSPHARSVDIPAIFRPNRRPWPDAM